MTKGSTEGRGQGPLQEVGVDPDGAGIGMFQGATTSDLGPIPGWTSSSVGFGINLQPGTPIPDAFPNCANLMLKPLRCLVQLGPIINEILFWLGLLDRVVQLEKASFCEYPPTPVDGRERVCPK